MKKYIIISAIGFLLCLCLYVLMANSIIKKSDISIGAEWLGRKVYMQMVIANDGDKNHKFNKGEFDSVDREFLNRAYCKYTLVLKDDLVFTDLKDDTIIAALIPTETYPRFSIGKLNADCLTLNKSGAVLICKIENMPLAITK